MSKITTYLKSKKPGWWITNVLLILVLAFLFIPGLRSSLIVWMAEQRLDEATVEENKVYYVLQEEDYNLSFVTPTGEESSLVEFKGEVIFLNYWATWCTHCLAEFSSLERLSSEYGSKVKFIFYTYEEKEVVDEFIERRDYQLPFYSGLYAPPEMMKASSFPTTLIINKAGEVVLAEFGAKIWDSDDVKSLLDKLVQE